jgi:hypothetical protein
MSFLYNELPPEERRTLQKHLETCPECDAQVNRWQRAAGEMSTWKLPSGRKVTAVRTVARWAVAAAVAGLAIAGGARLVAMNNEIKQLRAEVQSGRQEFESTLREQLAGEMRRDMNSALARITEEASRSASKDAQTLIAAVAAKLEEKRLTDQQAMMAALQKVNEQHVTDYASMRKELETVAVFTETGWQRTQNQIATLASSPGSFSNHE